MLPSHAASIVNIAGFVAGTSLYAMLLVMLLRPRLAMQDARRPDRLLILTGLLGLIWNLEALVTDGLREFGVPPLPRLAQATAYGALGLLPAVVVHATLRSGVARLTSLSAVAPVACAYALSGSAALIQLGAAFGGAAVPAPAGLRLLTFGFAALILPLAVLTRGQPGARRALWITALAMFAASALHLSHSERPQTTWIMELVGHHASLPIALSILYQEYPFVLADVFLKRAMTLLSLTTATLLAHLAVDRAGLLAAAPVERDVPQLVFLGVALGTALLYPVVTRFSTWFVDTVVLRRVDYEHLRILVSRRLNESATPREALDQVCAVLGPALSAAQVTWQDSGAAAAVEGLALVNVPSLGITADLTIPTAERPRFEILVRALSGGRRLLSDDVAMLESVALLTAKRIDGLRFEQERAERTLREEETQRLASEAELRALRAQLDPHFLFNALTTIGYLIDAAPDRAVKTLLRLTDLLRHVLGSDRKKSTLGSEVALIAAYLDIERARFEARLTVQIDVPEGLHGTALPPLLIQPLVENAIKHGIAPFRQDGRVCLRARVNDNVDGTTVLVIQVEDSGPGLSIPARRPRGSGVGLTNVEQRLERIYGGAASLTLTSRPGGGTTAELRVPVALASQPAAGLRGTHA